VSRDEREHGSRTSKTRRDVRTSESRDTVLGLKSGLLFIPFFNIEPIISVL